MQPLAGRQPPLLHGLRAASDRAPRARRCLSSPSGRKSPRVSAAGVSSLLRALCGGARPSFTVCPTVPGSVRTRPACSHRALRGGAPTFREVPPLSLCTQQPLRPGSCRARRRVRRAEPHPAAFCTFGGGSLLRRRLLAEMRPFCPRPSPGDGVSFLAVIAEPRPAARQSRPGLPGAAGPALPVPSRAAVRGDAVGLRAPSRRPCASSAALARCASPAGRWEAGGKPEIRKQLISAGASGAFILTGQRLAPCTEESE